MNVPSKSARSPKSVTIGVYFSDQELISYIGLLLLILFLYCNCWGDLFVQRLNNNKNASDGELNVYYLRPKHVASRNFWGRLGARKITNLRGGQLLTKCLLIQMSCTQICISKNDSC